MGTCHHLPAVCFPEAGVASAKGGVPGEPIFKEESSTVTVNSPTPSREPSVKRNGEGAKRRTPARPLVTWSENLLCGRSGVELGTKVLFTRLTGFLSLKITSVKLVIKSLKIAYLSIWFYQKEEGRKKTWQHFLVPERLRKEQRKQENTQAELPSPPNTTWATQGLLAVFPGSTVYQLSRKSKPVFKRVLLELICRGTKVTE